LAKLRAALPAFRTLRAFIATFAATAVTVSQVMEILKHKGLHRSTYKQCCQRAEQLPANSIVNHRLRAWLSRHIDIQRQLTSLPLVISSDIVESLFGNFKHILERSPQADMIRSPPRRAHQEGISPPALYAAARWALSQRADHGTLPQLPLGLHDRARFVHNNKPFSSPTSVFQRRVISVEADILNDIVF